MKMKHFGGFETLSLFLILHFFFLTNKFLHIRIVKSFFNGFPLIQINLVNKELGFKFNLNNIYIYIYIEEYIINNRIINSNLMIFEGGKKQP